MIGERSADVVGERSESNPAGAAEPAEFFVLHT